MSRTLVSQQMIDSGALTGLPMDTKGQLVVRDEAGANVAVDPPTEGQILVGRTGAPKGMRWEDPADVPEIPTATGSRLVGEIIQGAFAATPALFLACNGAAVDRTAYAALYAALGGAGSAWGQGDGATTFNVPDLRGRAMVGQGTGLHRSGIASVFIGTETINLQTAVDWRTGTALVYTTTGAAIDGLVSGTTYYWIRSTSTAGKLAATRADAIAGIAINLLDVGTGTQSLQLGLGARTVGEIGGEEGHSLIVNEIPSHTHTKGFQVGSGTNGGDIGAGTSTTGATGGSQEHNNLPPYAVVGVFIYAGV